jgi:hypothetical protein
MGTASTGVPARALDKNHVLAEFIAKLSDSQVPHASTVQTYRSRLKSHFWRKTPVTDMASSHLCCQNS